MDERFTGIKYDMNCRLTQWQKLLSVENRPDNYF